MCLANKYSPVGNRLIKWQRFLFRYKWQQDTGEGDAMSCFILFNAGLAGRGKCLGISLGHQDNVTASFVACQHFSYSLLKEININFK